jgi:hypothetical protein
MANLQATKVTSSLAVEQNTFIKLGNAVMSSGTFSGLPLAHFGNGPYFTTAWNTNGIYMQCVSSDFNFAKFTSPTNFVGLSLTNVSSNSTTTNLLGLGAAAGTAAGDGKLYINAGDAAGTVKPFLEVTNCLGDGSISTATKSVFKGYLGIKIGAGVGAATSVVAGTYYLRLWNNT